MSQKKGTIKPTIIVNSNKKKQLSQQYIGQEKI